MEQYGNKIYINCICGNKIEDTMDNKSIICTKCKRMYTKYYDQLNNVYIINCIYNGDDVNDRR